MPAWFVEILEEKNFYVRAVLPFVFFGLVGVLRWQYGHVTYSLSDLVSHL
jgi:hypothetical protein